MRYYQSDGTYKENPLDSEFGWFFSDIAIDEAASAYREHNEKIRQISRLRKSRLQAKSRSEESSKSDIGECCDSFGSAEESGCANSDDIEESVDVLAEMEKFPSFLSRTMDESIDVETNTEPLIIHKIEPNIKVETPHHSVSYQKSVEGFIENPESHLYKESKKSGLPSTEQIIALINPVNPESRALLSVLSTSKFQHLKEKEANEDILKTINFRATNSKHIITKIDFDSPFGNNVDLVTKNENIPDFNFILNDNDEVDSDRQLVSEINAYHATKEDNMLSLMMELIITDMDSNLGDMSELNNSVNELNNIGATETSDLGNSIHSSLMSKEGNGAKENKLRSSNYLNIPISNRSDILSSIGLSEDIDKSIEYFTKEKSEMHMQLCEIKKSFEEDEKKVESLINQATSLENDLRETTYLDNLIHLLNGNPEKVKNKKLPFRMFHNKPIDYGDDADFNLIV